MALLLVAVAVSVYGLVNAALVSHTPEEIWPRGAGSNLDAGLLEGQRLPDVLAQAAATGGAAASGQMPLQGTIVHEYSSQLFNTVPLALPKAGCDVVVSACGGSAAAMTVNANPINAMLKGTNQISLIYSYAQSSCNPPSGSIKISSYNDEDCMVYTYCPSGTTVHYYSRIDRYLCLASPCPADMPNIDIIRDSWNRINAIYCYANQRCEDASAGEISFGYRADLASCAYCPAEKPLFDARLASCLSNNDIATTDVATCRSFKATLETTLTTLSFKSGGSVVQPQYVAIAYSCPAT